MQSSSVASSDAYAELEDTHSPGGNWDGSPASNSTDMLQGLVCLVSTPETLNWQTPDHHGERILNHSKPAHGFGNRDSVGQL